MKKLDFIIHFLENKDAMCTNIESNTNLLPAFPLTTIENFFKFEKELQQDREIRKQLVSIFRFKTNILYIGLFVINII